MAIVCLLLSACANPDGSRPHLSADAPAPPGFDGAYAGASPGFGGLDARAVPF